MPSLQVANAGLLRLIWGISGVPYAVNVMGVINPSGTVITQGITNAVGAAVKSALASSGLSSSLHNSVDLLQVGLRNIHVPNQAELLDTGGTVSGTGGGQLLPPQTSLVVTLRTAQAGPKFRGRVYLPGWASASNDNAGTCVAGAAQDAVDFITAIQSALTTSGLTLAVLHRPVDANLLHIPPIVGEAGFATAVTAILVRDRVWDTQRRRAVPGI